jgi:dTDP-4-amino-4,6-dideoxygalactose transaminase
MNEQIRAELERHNIESRPLWKPLHQQPVFLNCKSYVNGLSDKLFNSGLCLPSGSNIDDNKIENIVTIIKKSL